MARPKKYDPAFMAKVIEKYTDDEDIPILKEVCYQNHWNDRYIWDLEKDSAVLSESIKRLLMKKEVQLERLALFNVINNTMAIFSLKQLGWKDKQETSLTTIDNNGKPKGLEIIVKRADG